MRKLLTFFLGILVIILGFLEINSGKKEEKESIVFVGNKNGHVMTFDKNGSLLFEKLGKALGSFSQGVVPIEGEEGQISYIDIEGYDKFALAEGFTGAREFKNGVAVVEAFDKFGAINKKGVVIVEPKYDKLDSFTGELSRFFKDEKYGYIDILGKEVIPGEYLLSGPFSDALAWIVSSAGFQYIDSKGKIAFKENFGEVNNFHDGFAVVKDMKGNLIIIDGKGKEKIKFGKPQGENKKIFSSGLLGVEKDGKWGFSDGKNIVIPYEYEDVDYFVGENVAVKKDGKYGVIDRYGEVLIEFMYDRVKIVEKNGENFYFIDKEGEWGVLNSKFKKIIDQEFDEIF